jgi:hypothetical protein
MAAQSSRMTSAKPGLLAGNARWREQVEASERKTVGVFLGVRMMSFIMVSFYVVNADFPAFCLDVLPLDFTGSYTRTKSGDEKRN